MLWVCIFVSRLGIHLALILFTLDFIYTVEGALCIYRYRLRFDNLRDRLLSIRIVICRLMDKVRFYCNLCFSRVNTLCDLGFLGNFVSLIIALSLIYVLILERLLWGFIWNHFICNRFCLNSLILYGGKGLISYLLEEICLKVSASVGWIVFINLRLHLIVLHLIGSMRVCVVAWRQTILQISG